VPAAEGNTSMDWMTLTIELLGLVILLIWTVIPFQEFRQIFKHLLGKQQRTSDHLTAGGDISDRN
jgi:hypothetical protein